MTYFSYFELLRESSWIVEFLAWKKVSRFLNVASSPILKLETVLACMALIVRPEPKMVFPFFNFVDFLDRVWLSTHNHIKVPQRVFQIYDQWFGMVWIKVMSTDGSLGFLHNPFLPLVGNWANVTQVERFAGTFEVML